MDKIPSHDASLRQTISYILPIIVTYYLIYPLWAILPSVYSKYFGLSLASVASAITLARFFDAVTDPLVGYFSDRYRDRHGTRKPWVLVGCIMLIISGYFLYAPPVPVTQTYFMVVLILFALAWTLVEIPHLAWGGELTCQSDNASKIYTARAVAIFIGGLMATAIPAVIGKGFTPEVLKQSVFISAVLILPLLYMCLSKTPNGAKDSLETNRGFKQNCRAIYRNRPLLLLLLAYCLSQGGYGMSLAMGYIFADSYLQVGPSLPLVFSICTVVAVVALLVIYRLPGHWEKKRLWIVAEVIKSLTMFATSLLTPGEGVILLLLIVWSFSLIGFSLSAVYIPSILSDIADFGLLKFSANHSALYFACYQFITKFSMGLGGGVGFAIAAWFGVELGTTEFDAHNLLGVKLSMAYLPAVLTLLSIPCILAIPLNRRQQQTISAQLVEREKHQPTALA